MTKGYGLVYKNIMTDKSFSIEAKSIYAYLSSYAGNDGEAFPSVARICDELCIGEDRFRKHLKQLINAGVVVVTPIKQNGNFPKNSYKIKHDKYLTPYPCGTGTPYPQNEGIAYPCFKGIPYPQNTGTTINSITINKDTINNNNKDNDVDSLNLQDKAKEYKNKIDNKIGSSITLQTVINLIKEFGEENINLYLNNWDKFKNKVKKNPIGLFINSIKEQYPIQQQEVKQSFNAEISNMQNFEQREYDNNFFDKFYFKTE